ncbi:alpha/beta hydrolase [Ramlibacter albus]|uniref:Alpha/beta hydrolase n=1 Tax=Ramlibacter albus TaxID=2079448 RepID=A0A923MFR4_9BURK|nr:alpha/beta hydrolase [Ramlibacter albus]MBC5768624.1 alpha/beta hydrolase [Ramlibacter albus]
MLHPQAAALLRLMEEKKIPPVHTLTAEQAREFYLVRRAVTQPAPPDVAAVRELKAKGPAGDIPLRLYRPAGSRATDALPVLVYYHGGGFVIGDLDTHDVLCRELSNASGCAVVAVHYRLAPEHRFPAACDDCVAATRWVHANAGELHLDPARLAVGGDSAGGNLAAVVAIAARDEGGLPVKFQLLIYPTVDARREMPSHTTNGQGYLLTKDSITYYDGHYFGNPIPVSDWRASPLLHEDLRNLPPAFVLTAGYDPLRDEGIAYAQKLTEAGNTATLVSFERQIHGFITMGKVIDEANVAVQMCATQLKQALQP